MDALGPIIGVIIKVSWFSRSVYKYYDKAPFWTVTIGVWIMQVSLFSSVLINRFHCSYNQ